MFPWSRSRTRDELRHLGRRDRPSRSLAFPPYGAKRQGPPNRPPCCPTQPQLALARRRSRSKRGRRPSVSCTGGTRSAAGPRGRRHDTPAARSRSGGALRRRIDTIAESPGSRPSPARKRFASADVVLVDRARCRPRRSSSQRRRRPTQLEPRRREVEAARAVGQPQRRRRRRSRAGRRPRTSPASTRRQPLGRRRPHGHERAPARAEQPLVASRRRRSRTARASSGSQPLACVASMQRQRARGAMRRPRSRRGPRPGRRPTAPR